MIYITGDTHREFYRLHDIEKNKDNMLIILGDAGINYYLDDSDKKLKEQEMLPETKAILFNIFRDYLSTKKEKNKIKKWQLEDWKKLEEEKKKK